MTRAIILMLLTWPVLANATTVLVTSCGQTVHGVGELTGNLDCSGVADEGVRLTGRLLLGGFTITGHPSHDVIECAGGCVVVGPGTITGGSEGIRGDGHVKVMNVTCTLNTGDGVHADSNAGVSGATITDNAGDGIRGNANAKVTSSTVSGNGGSGVQADRGATVSMSTVTGNDGDGIAAEATVRLRETAVSGNGFDGVRGRRVVLKDASATGNATSASCGGIDECADLASATPPRLNGAITCGTSRNTEGGGTWGVCTSD
jgi:hypothetical protein